MLCNGDCSCRRARFRRAIYNPVWSPMPERHQRLVEYPSSAGGWCARGASMTESDPAVDDTGAAEGDAYSQRMRRRKAIQDRRMSETVSERSLVIVHTGAGKGKTTA